jgi:polyisoprenyl-phosphate glycosyltransferase
MTTEVEISVVVPVYNSSRILPELVNRLSKVLKDNFQTYEIILVDDCSPDDSWSTIRQISERTDSLKAYRLGKNVGQMKSGLFGLSCSSGKFIVTIDDDLEYSPEDIPAMYQKLINEDLTVVFGLSPLKYTKQGKSVLLAKWRNTLINILWHKVVTDSFKIVRRTLLFDMEGEFLPKVHFEAFMMQHLDERFIGYCTVAYNARRYGQSNHTLLGKMLAFLNLSLDYYPNVFTPIRVLTYSISIIVLSAVLSMVSKDLMLLLIMIAVFITSAWVLIFISSVLKKMNGAERISIIDSLPSKKQTL